MDANAGTSKCWSTNTNNHWCVNASTDENTPNKVTLASASKNQSMRSKNGSEQIVNKLCKSCQSRHLQTNFYGWHGLRRISKDYSNTLFKIWHSARIDRTARVHTSTTKMRTHNSVINGRPRFSDLALDRNPISIPIDILCALVVRTRWMHTPNYS